MWTKELLGTDVYHLVAAFVLYSILGWLIESIYMSFCNKKLTNRGFGRGPFCPIYGVGGVCGYLILAPLKGHHIAVYFLGAILATVFEYLVGIGMIKFLGELWWDYNDKPFNYKGILCLESTIAWGFYAVGIVHFVHDFIYRVIDSIDMRTGIGWIQVILVLVVIDYIIKFMEIFNVDLKEKKERIVERYHSFVGKS